MTREEAIKLIEHVSIVFMPTDQYGDYDDPQPYEEAFDMAIEALSQPIVCKDYRIDNDHIYCSPEVADRMVEALSKRPKGEWQKVDEQPYFRKHFDNVCCSVCHHKGMRKYNYCPNCGAMMTPYKVGDDE